MELKKFIIHELVKEETDPILAEELLDLDDVVINKLAEKIMELFHKKTSVIWGVLKNLSYDFPLELKTTYQSPLAMCDRAFIDVTSKSMKRLREKMAGTAGTGGYIAFIEYEQKSVDYIAAFMIKNTEAFRLTKLKPESVTQVDTTRLYQAICVNTAAFMRDVVGENNGRSYVRYFSKSSEPSGYFIDAFSCENNVTPSMATKKAPAAVKAFLIEECGLSKDSSDKAHWEVVDFLIDNINKPVTLEKINNIVNKYIPEDKAEKLKDQFITYAQGEKWQIPEQFQPQKGTALSLRVIKSGGKGWDVSFEKDILGLKNDAGDKVFLYDKVKRELVITSLPVDLVRRIEEELNILDENGKEITEKAS